MKYLVLAAMLLGGTAAHASGWSAEYDCDGKQVGVVSYKGKVSIEIKMDAEFDKGPMNAVVHWDIDKDELTLDGKACRMTEENGEPK